MRKLKDGSEVAELETPTNLIIKTKCPNKWKLIDMETGEEYIGRNPNERNWYWRRIND